MSDTLCSICLVEEADTAAIPCGHVFGCWSCANRVKNTIGLCPICRKPIESLLKIRKCGEKMSRSASSAGIEASAAGNKKARTEERANQCVLCNKQIVGFGNNAAPLANGKCCDECNTRVMRQRIAGGAPDILQTARTAAASAAAQPPAASAAAQATGLEFPVHVRTLTGQTYTFMFTSRTSLARLYQGMEREANMHSMQMQFMLNSKSLPRIEDDGVQRPFRDFNISSETTIHLVMRLGRPRPAPYRREDWFLAEPAAAPPNPPVAAVGHPPTPAAAQNIIERCFRSDIGPATFRGELSTADEFIALWTAWKQKVRELGKVGPSSLHEEQFSNHVMPFLRAITEGRFMYVKSINRGDRLKACAGNPNSLQLDAQSNQFQLYCPFGRGEMPVLTWFPPNVYSSNEEYDPRGGWIIHGNTIVCAYASYGVNQITTLPSSFYGGDAIPYYVKAYFLAKWREQSSDYVGEFADSRNM